MANDGSVSASGGALSVYQKTQNKCMQNQLQNLRIMHFIFASCLPGTSEGSRKQGEK